MSTRIPYKKINQFSVLLVIACLACVQAWSLLVYVDDQRFLESLMNTLARPTLSSSEQVMASLEFFRKLPVVNNDHQYFLLPIFGFLRPTPRQIVEGGGDCADRSRLLINLLHIRGIEASKWALYSENLIPEHAVVEVMMEKGKMVVDPLFGLVFPDGQGGYHNIHDLRSNSNILRSRLNQLQLTGVEFGAVAIEKYPLDRYIYQYARTINWDKNSMMKMLYVGFSLVFGNKVNEIPRPYIVEQPALMIFWGMMCVQMVFILLWLVVRR